METIDLVSYSYEQGQRVLEKKELKSLKEHGQFLTPPAVARYMAKQLGPIKDRDALLEPAIGSGVLACAVIEQLINEKRSDDVFRTDEVLQENIVFSFEKLSQPQERRYWAGTVNISASTNETNLDGALSRQVSFKHFLGDESGLLLFRLPTGILDEQILDAVDRWVDSFEKYGLQVSTGRVVPFRAKLLLKDQVGSGNGAVPLLWMQNVKPYQVEYPLEKLDKPQAILSSDPSLLVPNSNYVLLRRFSAKEDRRRLISAPFIGEYFDFREIGFENHLNVIFKKKGTLTAHETIGLSALLNSAIIDRYFRIVNGNTQVNAAEVRALPLPPLDVITEIGKKVECLDRLTSENVDGVIFSTLWSTNLLNEEFPMIQETRITMGKIEQAGIVIRNADDPTRPTNSGLNNYVLSDLALDTIRAYGSPAWNRKRKTFLDRQGKLLELYQKAREQDKISLRVADGTTYKLSPGRHNQLQSAIVSQFWPRFAPNAKLLYLGDTAKKTIVFEKDLLTQLGVPVSEHGKFADIILYDKKQNGLFLIEAVTTHGPVSPKRQMELEKLLEHCSADRIYITPFPDFTTFKKFVNEIAWETEVWIAEMPFHMIHFNGDKFLGPTKTK